MSRVQSASREATKGAKKSETKTFFFASFASFARHLPGKQTIAESEGFRKIARMSEHKAIIRWTRNGPDFVKGKYSREHSWAFDGGLTIPVSPSPVNVPSPWSNAASVDPEEAFVASISSCHMLTFIWLASRSGFIADGYEDEAVGVMTKNERGVPWVSTVKLRPRIVWSGDKLPTPTDLDGLHHAAHEQCFIANSVKTEVTVEAPLNS